MDLVYVISMNWMNKTTASKSKAKSLGRYLENFYKRNSSGKYLLKTRGFAIDVPFSAKKGNIRRAEAYCRNKLENKNVKVYC